MHRREFLKLAAAGSLPLLLPGCSELLDAINNDGQEQLWGMNVHPYGEPYRSLQVDALRTLGIRRVRITLGLERDLASPYIGAYAAEYLGILGDFDLGGVSAAAWPGMVRRVMSRGYPLAAVEVLNEPDLFLGLPAATYVQDYLRPAYEIIREMAPGLMVVAGAPRGTQDGATYFLRMTDAGADSWCDRRGAHLYSRMAEQYDLSTDRSIVVSETGIDDPARHLSWWRETMTDFSGTLDTDWLFWYTLMDRPLTGYNLIREQAGGDGLPSPTSDLYAHIRDTF
jgi:hypothetical protein